MRDVLSDLIGVWATGATAGMATVVRTFRSAPRPAGASLVVMPDGTVSGSVSGGCVEAAVYELAAEVARQGRPQLQRYGVSEDDAFAVGLTCGGTLDVFVEPVSRDSFPQLAQVCRDIEDQKPTAVVTVISHPDAGFVGRRLVVTSDGVSGALGCAQTDRHVIDEARGLLASGRSTVLSFDPEGRCGGTGLEIFVACYSPKPRMIVFGAIDFAGALARQGALLGYRVTVCDARPLFATAARFPTADEVVVQWPHRYLAEQISLGAVDDRSAICVLTHDPKFDVSVLEVALRAPVGYVGAMGSRRTHDDRLGRLRAAGLAETDLARLHSPIGLDLGARTPAETAVSIVAEIIAQRWGGGGRSLAELSGPIHAQSAQQRLDGPGTATVFPRREVVSERS